jgi:hypothetical protein
MRTPVATRLAILASLSLGGLAGCDEEQVVTPLYNHANNRIVIQLTKALDDGLTVYTRARRGSFGALDCAKLVTEVTAIEDTSGERFDGPVVDQQLTRPIYDGPEWFDPTPEMLAQLAQGVDSIIDVCIMDGDTVVHQIERDLFQAWDKARKVDQVESLDMKAQRMVACPHCNSRVEGGKFCPECGKPLAAKADCGKCGAEMAACYGFVLVVSVFVVSVFS